MKGDSAAQANCPTKNRILTEAKRLFLSQGFKETSIRQIGAAAGVTSGALYKHFTNKEEILEVMVSPLVSSFNAYCEQSYAYTISALKDPVLKDDVIHRIINNRDSSWALEFFNTNLELWRFIIFGSQGTAYEGFIETFIEWECSATISCIEASNGCPLEELPISHQEVRSITRGFIIMFLDALKEDFPQEYRDRHLNNLAEIYRPFWIKVFSFNHPLKSPSH